MKPPPPLEFYRVGSLPIVGIQRMDLLTDQPVNVAQLECYRATANIETPWFRFTLLKGSKLFFTPEAAADLIAAGKLERILPSILVRHRKGHEAPETSRWADAGQFQKTISREKQAAPGMAKPAGDPVKPKAEPIARPRKR